MSYYLLLFFFTNNAASMLPIFHDSLNAVSYPWEYVGNVSSVSSINCPSFQGLTICVSASNSYNLSWDGHYEWSSTTHQSEPSNTTHSIYRNIQSNRIISEINSNFNEYNYYFHNYETNDIFSTRCIANNISTISDCNGKWENYHNNQWNVDKNISVLICNDLSRFNYQYYTLPTFQENQICIQNSSNVLWNGIYKWLYYDSFLNNSAYYNVHKNTYIYPGIKSYTIYSNQILKARCNSTSTDIKYCLGKWEVFNNGWSHIDKNMISTRCQSLCLYNTDHPYISNGSVFEYSTYHMTFKANIYKCINCLAEIYLFPAYESGNHYWTLGDGFLLYQHYCLLGTSTGAKNNFTYNLQDCLNTNSWHYYGNMYITKCDQHCVKLHLNSKFHRSFVTNGSYQNLAIGFDLNTHDINNANTSLISIEYSCHFIDTIFKGSFHINSGEFPTRTRDIIYNLLSPMCDNALSINVEFETSSQSDVYINNFYVFQNSSNTLLFDNMDSNDWTVTYQKAIGGFNSNVYCLSDSKCYLMYISPISGNNHVYITKTVHILNGKYKNLRLEWSLITNGLSQNTTINIGVYCGIESYIDNNLVVLKQYNINNDCNIPNDSCNIQSINLPNSKCDFIADIIIIVDMFSMSSIDEVYIDYFHLTHSHSSSFKNIAVNSSQTFYYPYFYYDNLNSLLNWQSIGNVTSHKGSNCPVSKHINTGNKLCISASSHSYWDGQYIYKYFDKHMNGIIYHNKQTNKYIYQYNNEENTFKYYLRNYEQNTISARCIVSNVTNIRQCIGNWENYLNGSWNIDKNITSIVCNDICIKANDGMDIANGSVFKWDGYFKTMRSNYYYSQKYDVYLTGYIYPFGNQNMYVWALADNVFFLLDSGGVEQFNLLYFCLLSNDFSTVYPNNYVFNIEDCTSVFYDKWYAGFSIQDTVHISASTCSLNHGSNSLIQSAMCAKLDSNSEIYRAYSIETAHNDLAIGFDVNMISLTSFDKFMVKYSCNEYHNTLTEFAYHPIHSYIINFVYSLLSEICDNSSSISLQFIVNGTSKIFIDNIYLYYNVNNEIYFEKMSSATNWIMYPETTNRYDVLTTFNTNYDYIFISRTIEVSDIGYRFKDYNFEYKLQTNGLSENSILYVKYQCDNNYFYVYDLCILTQYDSLHDCTDESCAIQSYKLPSECDLSTQITIQFYLQSLRSSNDEIYIQYVKLTHSNAIDIGEQGPLCRTLSPTLSPTIQPTVAPVPLIKGKFSFTEYSIEILLVVAALILLCCVLICIVYCLIIRNINKHKEEMIITNAMVILLSIGEYDNNLALNNNITDLKILFGENNLNYTIYPKHIKIHWQQKEIINLLKVKAQELHDQIEKYDGLMVIVSCYGVNNNNCIYTSDCKAVDKVAVHRLFSTQFANVRNIPRLFCFDLYQNESIDNTTDLNSFGVDDIEGHDENWVSGDNNPDHRLVEIILNTNNANDDVYVSYMLQQFVEKNLNNLNNENDNNNSQTEQCIYQIFDEIQQELVDTTKTQIKTIYNNKTRYIKFQKNENGNDNVMVEMHHMINNNNNNTTNVLLAHE